MSTSELHRTAFDQVQRDLTDSWTDWEGWAWAADFGDPVAEHRATREASNLWDESALRKWDMKGPDALALADVLFTNDMAALDVGQVRYGALCDEQGKMIMDGTIFKFADDHCFSVTSYDSDLEWFRKVASDRGLDVDVQDVTDAMPHLQVQGPLSREILAPITEGMDLESCATSASRASRAGRGRPWAGCRASSRAPATPASWATSSTAIPTAPRSSGTPCSRPASRAGCARSACRRSRRCASSPGCCSPTSTTSRTRPTPSRSAGRRGQAGQAGRLHRQGGAAATRGGGHAAAADHAAHRGRRAARVRRERHAGRPRGRHREKPLSEPELRHGGDRDGDRRPRPRNGGQRVDVALGSGTVAATVAPFPLYDTAKKRPRA